MQNKASMYILNRHHTYDPLLGYTKDNCVLPGIQIWPEKRRWEEADIRILVLGGSTTMWPSKEDLSVANLLGEWAKYFGEMIEETGHTPIVFNAASCGYSTDQELLKLLRDGPGISPNLVISMSGINDFGFSHSVEPYPMTHKFQSYMAKKIVEMSTEITNFILGVPWKCEPSIRWLRNVRICRMIANDLGAEYIACLQPMLGISSSSPTTDKEMTMIEDRKRTTCRNRTYFDEANRFYDEVRACIRQDVTYQCVINLVDAFEGQSAVWSDCRHPNKKGNRILASQIFARLRDRHIF